MREKQKKCINYSFSLVIMYGSSYMFRHYIVIFRERFLCLLRDAELRSSRWNIMDGRVVSSAPQFSISQKAQETLPEDGNVMPKHVGGSIHK
jgi:hypothetical protein